MTIPAKLTIDIYSDVMCPWCIIGYNQLQKGLAQLEGEIEAEVRWLPFELNPDMPPEGEGQSEHIARKYGRNAEEMEANRGRLIEIGRSAGYSFEFSGEGDPPKAMIWNTFSAHKILKWVLIEHGAAMQSRLKLALFDAHFQQRRNLGDPHVLVEIAGTLGLDSKAVRAAIDDPVLSQIVRQEQVQAWDMNISGVPAMVVQGKFLIPGAQEPDAYAKALRRVAERGI